MDIALNVRKTFVLVTKIILMSTNILCDDSALSSKCECETFREDDSVLPSRCKCDFKCACGETLRNDGILTRDELF